MRKILISILLSLLLIWTIYFMVNGASAIGVKGFLGLKEENEALEKQIETLSKTISNTYSKALVTLDSTKDNLIDTKTEYENQAALSNLNNASYTAEKFDIDYLWARLGNFANDEGVVIKMEIVSTGIDEGLYDLKFTTSGTYDDITNFIYDIEKDGELGFKIDEFEMTGDGTVIEAKFTCKEIYVDLGKKATDGTEIDVDNPVIDTNTTNSTNSTNSTTNSTSRATTNSTTNTTTNSTKTQTTNATKDDADTIYDEMVGN